MESSNRKERVIVYVDGFNLYFGMKEGGHKDTLWLNIQSLAQSLLKPWQHLVFTKYFTSRVRNDAAKERKQKTYIEAVETLADCQIYYGHYQAHIEQCWVCGHSYPYSNEKMTDVNIAVEMLADAYLNKYDMALLITGDSDLIPPINMVHELFEQKRIVVAFPPNRHNVSIEQAADRSLIIGRKKLKDAQFPEKIVKSNGFVLVRPVEWT